MENKHIGLSDRYIKREPNAEAPEACQHCKHYEAIAYAGPEPKTWYNYCNFDIHTMYTITSSLRCPLGRRL